MEELPCRLQTCRTRSRRCRVRVVGVGCDSGALASGLLWVCSGRWHRTGCSNSSALIGLLQWARVTPTHPAAPVGWQGIRTCSLCAPDPLARCRLLCHLISHSRTKFRTQDSLVGDDSNLSRPSVNHPDPCFISGSRSALMRGRCFSSFSLISWWHRPGVLEIR